MAVYNINIISFVIKCKTSCSWGVKCLGYTIQWGCGLKSKHYKKKKKKNSRKTVYRWSFTAVFFFHDTCFAGGMNPGVITYDKFN